MDWVEASGYVAALLVFASFWMKTMILLRVLAICSNIAFLVYGYYDGIYPVLALHGLLLPLNAYRLWQMQQLIESVKQADAGGFPMDWAVPHATRVRLEKGATLFRKGEEADNLYCLLHGRVAVVELDIQLTEGEMIGEIGLFSHSGTRTATIVCKSDCEFLALSYDTVRQLCLQNPQFGLYLMNVIARRLVANMERLEARETARATA